MKLGVPVIARNNVAHAAIVKHQSNGLLFTYSDVRTNSVVRVLRVFAFLDNFLRGSSQKHQFVGGSGQFF